MVCGRRLFLKAGFVVVLIALGVVALHGSLFETDGYRTDDPPMSFPVSKVVKNDLPPFRIVAGKPWRIEFGRGSGWHGLDTVKLDQDGHVILHRMKPSRGWETASITLPGDAATKVLEAIEENRLMELDKAYHANVEDGTQWVLLVKQGDQERSAYFNNHFPDQIVRFAAELDEILAAAVGIHLSWRRQLFESRQHEQELWDSIKR